MATLVGRAGLVLKGAWDSDATYDIMDVVTYNNSVYIAKQLVPAGTLPTNTTYWMVAIDASLLARKVASATAGNIATLDANGDLKDGGVAVGSTDISSIGDGSVKGAISNLDTRVTGNTSDITRLTTAKFGDVIEYDTSDTALRTFGYDGYLILVGTGDIYVYSGEGGNINSYMIWTGDSVFGIPRYVRKGMRFKIRSAGLSLIKLIPFAV